MKLIIPSVLLLLGLTDMSAQSTRSGPRFMGREVTIIEPELDARSFPKGPASVCVEGPPQRQCYSAPKEFWRGPAVAAVQVEKDSSALLFSAESYGVSGWQIHFDLLRPGTGKDLEELFLSDTSVSNQSQHAFWNDTTISDAQIFVTASYVWGPDEAHYDNHRYIISAYVGRRLLGLDELSYYLEDQFMTVRKYGFENADILASEKQEILARLRRVKAETELQPRTPR